MSVYDIGGLLAGGACVNVKDYGAVGDGVTDDAAAIQSALDSISDTGGLVFFPNGTYLITQYLFYYSNQTLYFENGATLLQGAAINALLISAGDESITEYNGTHDVVIFGGTFDGGEWTTNNTLVGCSHSRNIKIIGCKFFNAYGSWHNLEINSSANVLVAGCEFEGSRKTTDFGCMLQIDSFYSSSCYPWPVGSVDSTLSKHVEVVGCRFYDNTVSPAIGNHSNAGGNIRIHECLFEGLTCGRGAINFYASSVNTNIDIYNNTFDGCTYGVTIPRSPELCTVHDNRFLDVTTAVVTDGINAYNNMVNGTFTA